MTLKYVENINEETKECQVGLGTNTTFYKSIGMTEQDVEQGYDGNWYLEGYAPEIPLDMAKTNKLSELKNKRHEFKKTIVIKYDLTLEDLEIGTNHYENIKSLKYGWVQTDLDLFNKELDNMVNQYMIYKSQINACKNIKEINLINIKFQK